MQRGADGLYAPAHGVASLLVTADDAPIPDATSAVRAQAPLRFPTHTIKASTTLPHLASYTVPPLAYGSMEVTVSDPAVAQRMARPRTIPDPRMVPGRPHRRRRSSLLAAVPQR